MPIATKSSKIDISKEIITQKIAEKIASKVSKNTTLLFYGNIGVGKTTFIRYLINYLQKKNGLETTEIPSPTFNIVYEYKVKKFRIQHFDLYRLKKKKECLNIGLFEDDNAISIIEWPEKVHFKPKKRIEIYFKYSDNYNSRSLKIKFFGKK